MGFNGVFDVFCLFGSFPAELVLTTSISVRCLEHIYSAREIFK